MTSSETHPGPAAVERGAEILVVEDDPTNRILLRACLARARDALLRDAVVHEATTLADARQILARQRFRLVLLDMRLPDGNGLELAREILTMAEPRPAVLVLSASVLVGDRAAASSAGVDAFLGKPFTPASLAEAAMALLTG